MKLVSLFSGAGLGDLGWMMAGMDIVAQVEIEEYCQKILKLRFPETHKWRDIKNVTGEEIIKKTGTVDIMAGGVPCQAASVAGKQRGREDDRWLWPEAIRIVKEVKPRWVVWENVVGLLSIEQGIPFEDICAEMESCGYEVQTFSFTAHSLGANHRRERIWIVAHSELCGRIHRQSQEQPTEGRVDAQRELETSNSNVADSNNGQRTREKPGVLGKQNRQTSNRPTRCSEDVSDTNQKGMEGCKKAGNPKESRAKTNKQFSRCNSFREYWSTESGICRVVDGMPNRIHRLKALGNGQVVACTSFIGSIIMDFEKINKGQLF